MAERIKPLYINSAKWGTERQSQSNSPELHPQSESNSTRHQHPKSNGPVLFRQLAQHMLGIGRDLLNDQFKSLISVLSLQISTNNESGIPANQSQFTDFGDDNDPDQGRSSDTASGSQKDPDSNDDSASDDDTDLYSDSDKKSDSSTNQDAESDSDSSREPDEAPISRQTTSEEHPSLPTVSVLPSTTTREDLVRAQRPGEMVEGEITADVYYRTSSEEENDEETTITIDQQEPLVEAAKQAFDVEVNDVLKDKSVSGETFDRKGLDQIIEDAEEGVINVLIVSDIDRIGRICEKTIEFAKKLRENDVYIVANVRWYDVFDGDDLETFNAKAGRAEAENKKRGSRGNRGKLFKLIENGADSYLSWFKKVPTGCQESDAEKGIKLADDSRRDIPIIVLEEFMKNDYGQNEYSVVEERTRDRLREIADSSLDVDDIEIDVKRILQNPIYTGRATIKINKIETYSVDQSEITIPMPSLQLFDEEHIEMWEAAQEKIKRLNEKYRNKQKSRPEELLNKYGPEMFDEEVASWTLICPKCRSIGNYEYYGTTTDTDGTIRQKCVCSGGDDDKHFFRVPTRGEYEDLEERCHGPEDSD